MAVPSPRMESVMTGTHMSLARVYAEALLSEAREAGREREILEELDALVETLESTGALHELLQASFLSGPDRCEVVHRIFDGRLSELAVAFLTVLAGRNRLSLLRAVVGQLRRLSELGQGKIDVAVTTARALTDESREELRRGLREAFHAEPVLTEFVDDSLLGGVLVQVGDRVYDASVAGELRRLAESLSDRVDAAGAGRRRSEPWP